MFTFGKKTTATVLAGFQQTLNDLQEVERTHMEEAEQKRIEAEQATAAHQAALTEAAAARTVFGRIQSLLSTSDLSEGIGAAQPLRAVNG